MNKLMQRYFGLIPSKVVGLDTMSLPSDIPNVLDPSVPRNLGFENLPVIDIFRYDDRTTERRECPYLSLI